MKKVYFLLFHQETLYLFLERFINPIEYQFMGESYETQKKDDWHLHNYVDVRHDTPSGRNECRG